MENSEKKTKRAIEDINTIFTESQKIETGDVKEILERAEKSQRRAPKYVSIRSSPSSIFDRELA